MSDKDYKYKCGDCGCMFILTANKMDDTEKLALTRLNDIKTGKVKPINEKEGMEMLKNTNDIKKHKHNFEFFIKEVTKYKMVNLKQTKTIYLEFGCKCGATKLVEKKESD